MSAGLHAAAAHHRARLVADGRRQDVEVARQRRPLPGLRRACSVSMRLRYFVMREMPLGQDANFSDDAFLTRFNADLANDLGNLVSRATTMVQRYCDGVMPGGAAGSRRRRSIAICADAAIDDAIDAVKASFEAFQVSQALQDDVGADPARQQIHRRARAVGAGEGRRPTRDAEPDAVSRRRCAAGDCGARRSGDARCGGRIRANARRRRSRTVDDAEGRARWRPARSLRTDRTAVPEHRKNRRGTAQHDDRQRIQLRHRRPISGSAGAGRRRRPPPRLHRRRGPAPAADDGASPSTTS